MWLSYTRQSIKLIFRGLNICVETKLKRKKNSTLYMMVDLYKNSYLN